MKRSGFGRYVISIAGSDEVRAFVPAPLPPAPPLELIGPIRVALDQALLALGRLDGAAAALPDTHLLLYTYVRKEAVLSSQIEGTQSTLDDLLTHELGEAPGVPIGDVAEVSRYVEAMSHGLQRLRGDFPLSNRLLREMHEILLAEGRGAEKTPGEFRRSQNWIGGTRPGNAVFVPPPPQEVDRCMGELENFLHSDTPPLVKAALAHVQFETIHPFLDGNGRIGRLLTTLLLCHDRVLREPLLYSSLYLKQHRQQYYVELNAVRETGDFERWLEFFATAIRVSAEQATTTGQRIFAVFREDRIRIRELGRQAPAALLIQETLQSKPLATIAALTQSTGLTTPTVTQALHALEKLKIVRETTGRARGRIFSYVRYLDTLNSETIAPEPI
jgi:Fic family protein